jgi:hypothetical protein
MEGPTEDQPKAYKNRDGTLPDNVDTQMPIVHNDYQPERKSHATSGVSEGSRDISFNC